MEICTSNRGYSGGNITLVLLNGPPGCGKDTIGEILRRDHNMQTDKFARVLKEEVHHIVGHGGKPHDFFEEVKNEKIFSWGNLCLTPRQAYIMYSEGYIKPLYGAGYFGDVLARQYNGTKDHLVITDSGFLEEAISLSKCFDEVLVVRIYRNDKTFDGDSRSYWKKPLDFHEISLYNDGSIEELKDYMERFIVQNLL